MQTKISNKQKSLEATLNIFYKADDSLKKEILTALMVHYPEQYQEFIEKIDKKIYHKFMAVA